MLRCFRPVYLVFLLLWLVSACSQPLQSSAQQAEVVSSIREHYEDRLSELPLSLQRHYAQRLYRMTGDEVFLPYNHYYAQQLITTLRRDLDYLAEDPDYLLQHDLALLQARSLRTVRQRQRVELLQAHPGMTFATDLVFRMIQLDYYGLLDSALGERSEQGFELLAPLPFEAFVLSEEAVRHYAAQAANLVWFLQQLGVTDLREPFLARFQSIYPHDRDNLLSPQEYHNKIYGMTHIVIAASRYYQDTLPSDTFPWITDYFIDQLPRLLETATEDILAEVGISLALTDHIDHPAIGQLRQALTAAYDSDARMIPSPQGSTDFARGEHRNVLAVMLLNWPEELYPGPRIDPKMLEEFRYSQPVSAPEVEY